MHILNSIFKTHLNFQAQAEADVESAVAKAANYDRILTEQIDKLEEKKLNDIKVVFGCYIEELNCKNTF